MRKLLLIALTFLISIGLYHWFSHGNEVTGYPTSLSAIASSPGSFTDKPLKINARIVSATTVINYTRCLLSDSSGHTAWLISNKPLEKGEMVSVCAHLYVIYQNDNEQCAVLVDDHFKITKNIISSVFAAIN